jgi:Kef-type K+ transport system membrane component KefB
VLAIGVAVTSIPVISRILLDLGVIDTPFARIVLAAAVIEDVALYVLLAIALSLVHDDPGAAYGLPALLGVRGAGAASLAYHVAASTIFLAASLLAGPRGYRRVRPLRLFRETNPIANLLLLLFAITGLSLALGIAPFLGAFAAGLCANRAGEDPSGARHSIRSFSFAFLIPVYFALVGLRLDLVRDFQPVFFIGFLAFACAVKLASVYAGARVAGEGRRGAWNLAMAMNARGGPGIVLASVALDARIIDGALYTTLVVLSVVTSSIAGWWLERALRAGQPLR